MKKLCVIYNNTLHTYYRKGEIKERYFNPCNSFNEVHIITPGDQDIEEELVQTVAGKAKLKIYPIGKFSLFNLLSKLRRILSLMIKINPTLIRAYDPLYPGMLAVYCGRKLNIPTVISIHQDYEQQHQFKKWGLSKLVDSSIKRSIQRYSISNADKVICVTNFLVNYGKKHRAKDIEVIYNRVDTKRFMKSTTKNSDKMTILCVGRLTRQKYQECLIRAIKDLDVDLLLIGDGELYDNLKQLTKELGIIDKVKFIKSIPHLEIHKYYSSVGIFAIATHYEGFCIPVLEAMSSSLPVVASKVGPIQELVEDAGILIENKPYAFKKAFERLLSDSKLRKKLGEKGRKRALEVDGKIMERMERKLYEKVIEKYG